MPVPPRIVRRVLSPLFLAVEVGLAVGFTVAAAVAALVAPLTPRRRVLRIAAFGAAYMSVEIAVSVAALCLWLAAPRHWVRPPRPGSPDAGLWERRHFGLLAWALGAVLGAAGRLAGFRVVTEAAAGSTLGGDNPVLVLARHGGPGDSFALAHLLLAHGRRVRIVLKGVLQLDPALDVVLNRLPSCFLPRRSSSGEDVAERVAALAATLRGADALLLFPEGGNWTPRRRLDAIAHLRAERHETAARAAEAMEHVLPPRPAGFLACMHCRPDLDVAVVAHTGLDRLVTARAIWDALPLDMPMTVRWWWTPATLVPDTDEERYHFLTSQWAGVDGWIDARWADSAGAGNPDLAI